MFQFTITNKEFGDFRDFIYDHAGIRLNDEKKALVTSRLGKRLRHHRLNSFSEYFDLVVASTENGERQVAIDLLTTNETYFFREPKHFAYLEKEVIPAWNERRVFRIWSAASSTGEEAYSLAMLFDDMMGDRSWEVLGTDISSRVLKKARQGHYLIDRIEGIPKAYLQKYCLKGVGEHSGTLLVEKFIRDKVSFAAQNLTQPLDKIGLFDLVFLRNVMIYFDNNTKKKVIQQVVGAIRPGGLLVIGHSESITGMNEGLRMIVPTIHQKL